MFKINKIKLRPYQQECEDAVLNEWKIGNKKTLIQLATGLGKTVVFAHIAYTQRKKKKKILFIAHREELIMQGVRAVENICGEKVDIILGSKTTATAESEMVFASVASLSRDNRLNMYPEDYFDCIFIDEAHHSVSKTYTKILAHFSRSYLLGVTATPTRADNKKLSKVYQSMAYKYSLVDGIRDGWLSGISIRQVPLKIDITKVRVCSGDYSAADLGDTLEQYMDKIGDEIANVINNEGRKHVVVFTPLIKNSLKMVEILKSKGIRAAEINGGTENRNEILNKFESGEYQCLCNALLLTEGWDCPCVDAIVMLRPTKSQTLFLQAVGRGTRLCEGKKNLLLLDFLWLTKRHDLFSAFDMVANDEEELKRMRKAAESGNEFDLLGLQDDIQKRLLEELQANAAKEAREKEISMQKQKAFFALSKIFDCYDIAVYTECFAWEYQKPTQAQLNFFINNNLTGYIEYMSKGSCSAVIDAAKKMNRVKKGLCTIKQSAYLYALGCPEPGRVKYKDASNEISKYYKSKKKK